MRYAVDGHFIEDGSYFASTGRYPDWYLDEPELGAGDVFYITAFHRLSTERSMGSGAIGPIPNSKVTEYGQRWGLHQDMLAVFETVIFRLDDAYMRQEQDRSKLARARSERESARNNGKTKIR